MGTGKLILYREIFVEDIANISKAFRCALSRLVSWRGASAIDRLWSLVSREEETIRQAEQSRQPSKGQG